MYKIVTDFQRMALATAWCTLAWSDPWSMTIIFECHVQRRVQTGCSPEGPGIPICSWKSQFKKWSSFYHLIAFKSSYTAQSEIGVSQTRRGGPNSFNSYRPREILPKICWIYKSKLKSLTSLGSKSLTVRQILLQDQWKKNFIQTSQRLK